MAELESTIKIQSYVFHETQYGFENSTLYKNKLAEVRDQQKQLIKMKSLEKIKSANAEEYKKSCFPHKPSMINSLIVSHVAPKEEH